MKILIIEDDTSICEELTLLLENAGYEVAILKDFKNALLEVKKTCADLILLDIQIPFMNGELLLKEIRKELDTPVIMVTSKDSEVDEVLSISYGADDYITKPYHPTVLLLRIQNVLKRGKRVVEHYTYKDAMIYPTKGLLVREKRELELTKNEMLIFLKLVEKEGEIVSRDVLMTELWNNDAYINDNALTVTLSRLRSKLASFGYQNAIETRKGQGYQLL